jgi:two-component system CheB/CheR fusion protein
MPKSADLWRRRPVSMLEDYFERVVAEFMPPAVVVDDDNRVLHVFGDAGAFLSVPSGRADMDLLRMLNGPMRVVVGTALHKVRSEGTRITFRNVAVNEDDEGPRVDLLVDVHQNHNEEEFAIIVFRTPDVYGASSEPNAGDAYEVDAATEERIEALRRRLHYTEENLQATVEELETSNEELQATNEELMASNEELQSTNEELHSVNEELVTVNAELQEKIRKLTEADDDIDNLLRSTDLRALFLDANLCVRRSTPLIGELVNVVDSDEGRPVSHFTHVFPGVDLEDEAQAVLSSQTPREYQVQSRDDTWYSLHLRPYRRAEGDVDGVVITFESIPALDDAKQQGFGETGEGQIR